MKNQIKEPSSEEIFHFLNPKDNDSLSTMRGIDLQELIVLLDDYYLELREQLGLSKDITFGLELEFEHAMRSRIEKRLEEASLDNIWEIVEDCSLKKGAEINSPILIDTKENWYQLKKVCDIVKPYAEILENAGGHIHVGAQVLGKDKIAWLHFLRLWSTYENIIFRFTYGDRLTARPRIKEYAVPIAQTINDCYPFLKEKTKDLLEILWSLPMNRYMAINFNNVSAAFADEFIDYNTIEFRCPNGSLNPIIWQNNVNLLTKTLCYAKDTEHYQEDIIEKRNQSNHHMSLRWYDEIYLQQALELADLIFNNNLDKIYFLKQYLKSFEIRKKTDIYPKIKKLI